MTISGQRIIGRIPEHCFSGSEPADNYDPEREFPPFEWDVSKDLIILPATRERFDEDGQFTHGPQPGGYTLRLSKKVEYVYKGEPIDPKDTDAEYWEEVEPDRDGKTVIPAGVFFRLRSYEFVSIPHDLQASVKTIEEYLGAGVEIKQRILEPGQQGHIYITGQSPAENEIILYPGEGIVQIVLRRVSGKVKPRSSEPKQQDQKGLQIKLGKQL